MERGTCVIRASLVEELAIDGSVRVQSCCLLHNHYTQGLLGGRALSISKTTNCTSWLGVASSCLTIFFGLCFLCLICILMSSCRAKIT